MPLPKKLPNDFNAKALSSSGKYTTIIDRYKIMKKIGCGNFGTAFLIEDKEEDNNNKVMKQICVGPVDPGETVDAMREAKLLSQMQHKNIVQFHDSFLDGQFFCIVLEYCEGGDLECKVKEYKSRDEKVPENQVIKWLKQILKAISYMHERRVLHRDLKSRNIFLKNNEVKIGDFGISRILLGASDMASTFVGTPYFMSPEVLKHEQYDEKCDIWSLGCVLYEICCQCNAFDGKTLMAVMVKIVSDYTPVLPQNYSRGLNNILGRMLDRDPNKRTTAKKILQHPSLQERNANESIKFLTARDRLRIRKQREADERMQRLNEAMKIKCAENEKIRKQSKEKNFVHTAFGKNMQINGTLDLTAKQKNLNNNYKVHAKEVTSTIKTKNVIIDTIKENELHGTVVQKPIHSTEVDANSVGDSGTPLSTLGSTDEFIQSLIEDGIIPENEDLADTFYSLHDDFESSSSSDGELPDDKLSLNDSEYIDMFGIMEEALNLDESTMKNKETVKPAVKRLMTSHSTTVGGRETSIFTSKIFDRRISGMKSRCVEALGETLFDQAHRVLEGVKFDDPKLARQNDKLMRELAEIVPDRNVLMELEQLVYLEQEETRKMSKATTK